MNLTNSNRSFSAVANTAHWGPQAEYGWSNNVVLTGLKGDVTTGAWIPVQLDANGNLLSTLTNATVSGSFVVDNTNIVNALATGNLTNSGILQTLQTGIVVTPYNKVSSSGFASGFSPFAGPQIVKGIQGYSQCALSQGFLQVYDGTTLIQPIAVQSGNNFYADFAENGVTFNNFNIINASNPVINSQYATNDFFCVVIYR